MAASPATMATTASIEMALLLSCRMSSSTWIPSLLNAANRYAQKIGSCLSSWLRESQDTSAPDFMSSWRHWTRRMVFPKPALPQIRATVLCRLSRRCVSNCLRGMNLVPTRGGANLVVTSRLSKFI
ncbi:hypothetical protein D3C72_1804100 [compost metagenome]